MPCCMEGSPRCAPIPGVRLHIHRQLEAPGAPGTLALAERRRYHLVNLEGKPPMPSQLCNKMSRTAYTS